MFATKHVVFPAVKVTEAPVCWLPSNAVTLKPAAILIEDASLFTPPRLTISAVLKFPVPVKLATQPPKLQCWKSCTIGVPPPPGVVTEICPLWAEVPAWSIAATEKLYVVLGERFWIVTLVPDTELTSVPFWKMRYWMVQLAPAVEPFQLRVRLLDVTFEAPRPVGTLGITVHPPAPEQAPMLVHG